MTSLLCGCMIFDECRMFNARIAGDPGRIVSFENNLASTIEEFE